MNFFIFQIFNLWWMIFKYVCTTFEWEIYFRFSELLHVSPSPLKDANNSHIFTTSRFLTLWFGKIIFLKLLQHSIEWKFSLQKSLNAWLCGFCITYCTIICLIYIQLLYAPLNTCRATIRPSNFDINCAQLVIQLGEGGVGGFATAWNASW